MSRAAFRLARRNEVLRMSSSAKNAEQTTNALPFRGERKGIAAMAVLEEMIPLLLVVDCGALVFLTLGIGSIDCDGAALAIGRDHDVGRKNNLAAFF